MVHIFANITIGSLGVSHFLKVGASFCSEKCKRYYHFLYRVEGEKKELIE